VLKQQFKWQLQRQRKLQQQLQQFYSDYMNLALSDRFANIHLQLKCIYKFTMYK